MNNEYNNFKSSLLNNDYELFKKIKKGDLHVHALLGSSRKVFSLKYPEIVLEKFNSSDDISSLSSFIRNNIIGISTTKEGQLNLFECTILSAIDDGISVLEMSVDYRLLFEVYNNSIVDYVNDLRFLKEKYKDNVCVKYDLGISRNAYKNIHKKDIIKLLDSNIFDGIDIYGDELSKPIRTFKSIYRFAEKKKIIRKAHVGEFGTGKDVYKAIKILHLNVVQHGISIIEYPKAIRYAKKHNVLFNVCPISNLKLMRVQNIHTHPVRKMFDLGLKITINTDDQLIFENSLFDEYYLLFSNGIFTIEELNQIRLNSLN